MSSIWNAVRRRMNSCGLLSGKTIRSILGAIAVFTIATPTTVAAQVNSQVLEVRNDRGGLLNTRLAEIRNLRASGQPVMITGNYCYSTCTMFLGLPQTCVSPQTTFGFHGPSSYGRPLSKPVFDRASEVIASHYPDGIKQWYMNTGRHEIVDLYRIAGQELIRLGVPSCGSR